jgi:hypothetical protein
MGITATSSLNASPLIQGIALKDRHAKVVLLTIFPGLCGDWTRL